MANVDFELIHHFDAPARVIWDELVDWVGHEKWIPATQVEVHTAGDPATIGAEFTAWTGLALNTSLGRKLSLEDRMRVTALEFDDATATGACRVEKLGPILTGSASFTVAPKADGASGCEMHWVENVHVPYAPQFLAPVLAQVGVGGFTFGMKRLAKQLKTPIQG